MAGFYQIKFRMTFLPMLQHSFMVTRHDDLKAITQIQLYNYG